MLVVFGWRCCVELGCTASVSEILVSLRWNASTWTCKVNNTQYEVWEMWLADLGLWELGVKNIDTKLIKNELLTANRECVKMVLCLHPQVTGAVCSFESPSHPPIRLSWLYLWVLYLITAGWWAAGYGCFTSWYKYATEIRSAVESKRE